jgi:hypothetical protein
MCAQINSLLWISSQERFLVCLPNFSHRVWMPFKIHRRFKFKSVPKNLSWILLGIWSWAYWESCSKYLDIVSCKVYIFLEHGNASILNFKIWRNLKFIWKSIKWAGPTRQWPCTFGLTHHLSSNSANAIATMPPPVCSVSLTSAVATMPPPVCSVSLTLATKLP